MNVAKHHGSGSETPSEAVQEHVGVYAAAGACTASVPYGIAQLLQVADLLSTPLDRWLIFAPSLALAPLFVVAIAASAAGAPPAARAARLAAFGLAISYAVLVSSAYVIQLGVILPREMQGTLGRLAGFACCGFRMPLTAIDLLGYTEMSLAMLLLGFTYRRGVLRWLLIANGLLAPVILLQLAWPALIFWAWPWLIFFPLAMAALAHDLGRVPLETFEGKT